MAFVLLDRVTELQPGVSITAVKSLRPEEEYLGDHFPRFPVMPGVLMVETMYQAGAWLVWVTEDFRHSLVLLKEARNVKFADFVQPGQTLIVQAEIVHMDERLTTLKTRGTVGNNVAVSGRLVLERFNATERHPDLPGWEREARRKLRQRWAGLYQPAAGASPA